MTFNSTIDNKEIVAYTSDGIPYLWYSGDTTTPPSNQIKITASDGAANDYFSLRSVAVGDGRTVIGSQGDDDKGSNSGSAYLYDFNGNQLGKMTAYDGAASDGFGKSVAVGGGRIAIGAPLDSDSGTFSGSVYVFSTNGQFLSNVVKITPPAGSTGDEFGQRVVIGSGRIVVSAYFDDDKGSNAGSVYVFDLDGGLIKKITAYDGAASDNFGWGLAAGCGRIVVGAPYDDDKGTDSGSVYIYTLNGGLIKKITAYDGAASDNFGLSVAVGCGRIVVGAQSDDDKGTNSGSAYIYDLNGNLIKKITASDGASADFFGGSVAVGSGRIVVAAHGDDDNGSASGSAYVFDLDGNQIAKIKPSDGAAGDNFGNWIAIDLGKIVIGAWRDSDKGSLSGSAYIFDTPLVYTPYDLADLQIGGDS